MRRFVFHIDFCEKFISGDRMFVEVLGSAVCLISDNDPFCMSIADSAVGGW